MKLYRIDELKLAAVSGDFSEEEIRQVLDRALGTKGKDIASFRILRHSIDARKKPDIFHVFSLVIEFDRSFTPGKTQLKKLKEYKENKYEIKPSQVKSESRPVVTGMGPAGLFAGYYLAKAGLRPLVIERGRAVEKRSRDVEDFFKTGVLDTVSNVQFGEGGAGTFSDGKLNSRIKDPSGRIAFVLDTFVNCGAPERIRYEAMPHVGTDVLCDVVRNLRNEIIALGGEVRFETCLSDIIIEDGALSAIEVNGSERIPCHHLVLACGHSARDTFEMLISRGMGMEAKDFAVGFRIQHPQELINSSQYGERMAASMPPAPYRLSFQDRESGRGVYSFCMCPGGYVIDSSSEEGGLCVNGMSYADRGSGVANSAIVVSVTATDYREDGPLAGVYFQRELEKRAYDLAKGAIPQQLFGDYRDGRISTSYGEFSSMHKGRAAFSDLGQLFSKEMKETFIRGMSDFGHKIKGFDREDAILSGVEGRTSSPVRIRRDEAFLSNIRGIYPCGEGAGYAGGIMSAAVDGIKVGEKVFDAIN